MTKVSFPSVTVCNENGLDSEEYVRNVFNNLAFTGNKSLQLKEGFKGILDDLTVRMEAKYYGDSKVIYKFLELWMKDNIKYQRAAGGSNDYMNDIDEILRGIFMTHADNYDEYKLTEEITRDIDFWFGAMMRGEDFMNELLPSLPLKMQFNKWGNWLEPREVEWKQSFTDPLDEESARKCMIFKMFHFAK